MCIRDRCFLAAALILSQPVDGEDDIHAKNRVWILVFFALQALGALYVSYRTYRSKVTIHDHLLVAMLGRITNAGRPWSRHFGSKCAAFFVLEIL